MEDIDRYIANAVQAERLALSMTIQAQREELLKIAAEWRKLADDATARLEASGPDMV
jgi:hypothetical protein